MKVVSSKTLILIADSKVAKFYSSQGNHVQSLLKGIKAEKWWKILVQKGRNNFFQKMSVTSHFLDPHHDAKENERKSFSSEIRRALKRVFKSYPAESIIIFSDPKMRGEIRKSFDSKLKTLIHKEFSKDLTHCIIQEITDHLKTI